MLTLIENFDILNTFTGRGIFYVNNTMALAGGDLAKALSCEHTGKCRFLLEGNMRKEIWKDIVGYEESYKVSSFGRVKSLRRFVRHYRGRRIVEARILRQPINSSGYNIVTFALRKSRSVHRLVAQAFIKNDRNCPCVNHLDGNSTNNCVDNLEWCTYKENELHSINVLGKVCAFKNLHISRSGIDNATSKPVAIYDFNNNLLSVFPCVPALCRKLKYDQTAVYQACRGERRSYKNKVFKRISRYQYSDLSKC